MSNVLLAHNNWADSGTLTGPTMTLALSKLQNRTLSDVARTVSAALSNTWFRFDLGADKAVRVLSLVRHNLTSSAFWRARFGKASLWIDLSTDRLDTRITFTRATTRTYYGSDGHRTTAGVDVWPVEFNPATLARESRYIWRGSTNNFTRSEELEHADWARTGLSGVTTNAATGAWNTATMRKLVEDTGNSAHYVEQTRNVTTGTIYTVAVDAKAGERQYLQIVLGIGGFGATLIGVFDLVNGVCTHNAAAGGMSVRMQQLTNGTWRCFITAVATATVGAVFQFRVHNAYTAVSNAYLGNGTSGLYLESAQHESDSYGSPHIVTTTAAMARNFDYPVVSSLTGIYSGGPVTVVLRGQYAHASAASVGNQHLFSLTGSSANDVMRGLRSGTSVQQLVQTNAGGSQASHVLSATVGTAAFWAAFGFATNNIRGSLGGAAVVPDTTATLPTVTKLEIGGYSNSSSSAMNGCIYEIAVVPELLSDANLQLASTSGPTAIPSMFYDSGWVSAKRLTWYGAEPANWGDVYNLIAVTSEACTGRYGEIEINDTANPAGYIDLARLFVADGWQPAINMAYGDQQVVTDYSSVTLTPWGRDMSTQRDKARSTRFRAPYLTQAEADEVHELLMMCGVHGEVFYIPDPADAAKTQRYGFLGRLSTLSPLEDPHHDFRSASFELLERL